MAANYSFSQTLEILHSRYSLLARLIPVNINQHAVIPTTERHVFGLHNQIEGSLNLLQDHQISIGQLVVEIPANKNFRLVGNYFCDSEWLPKIISKVFTEPDLLQLPDGEHKIISAYTWHTLMKELGNLRQASSQSHGATNVKQYGSLQNWNLQIYSILLHDKAPSLLSLL